MSKMIIYKNDEGGVSVVVPTPDALSKYSIEQIADKDVPHGSPYKIIDSTDLPADRTFRNAWEVDEAVLTDGVGAEHSSF